MLDSPPPSARAASWPVVLAFLAAGALHWALFLGVPPVLPREKADWPKEFRYYAVLQQAVTEIRVPYFVSVSLQDTRKFLAIPETVLSPQIVLLRWLSVDWFFFVHVLLLQAAGLAGCLALRRRYALSWPAFAWLWLLLGFNGHLTSHLAIGHSMWGGCFLFPWFFLFVLELVDGAPTARTAIAIGGVLALMLLQGSFHPFVWCVLLLSLVVVFDSVSRRLTAEALVWTAAFSSWRLLPAALVLLGRRAQDFQTGFASASDLMAALVWVRDANFPRHGGGSMGGLRWWEFDTYVGVAAVVWLAFGGALGFARLARARVSLGVPMLIVALLAFGSVYRPLNAAHLPLLGAERVSSRLLILPLGLLAVVASLGTDEWLRHGGPWRKPAILALVSVTAAGLAWHSWVWSVPHLTAILPPPPHPRDLGIEIVAGSGARDALYVSGVRLSVLLSALTMGLAGWRWRRTTVG